MSMVSSFHYGYNKVGGFIKLEPANVSLSDSLPLAHIHLSDFYSSGSSKQDKM